MTIFATLCDSSLDYYILAMDLER